MSLPPSTETASVRRQLLLPFLAYFLLLASTSFIAGGIVHLGLGENTTYYLALAVLGVVCFMVGNYLQEFVLRKNTRGTSLGSFLMVSFVLSIGIGMMTGGVQHFLDNPSYSSVLSSVLIPVGLILAVAAFMWREGVRLGGKLPALLGGTLALAALLFGGLSSVARAMAVPSGEGHSHGQVQPVPTAAEEARAEAQGAASVQEAAPTAAPADTHEATDAHEEAGEGDHDH